MGETQEGRSWSRAPGWMKLLLTVSLLVNIAVAGLVGGAALRHRSADDGFAGGPAEPGLNRQQSRILRMVPEARREEAREILLARQAEIEAARDVLRRAQQALIEALRQEPVDAARLTAVLSERQAASGRMWGIGYEQMVEIALRLSPAERAEMTRQLEERTQRWMERQASRRSQ